MNIVFDLDGVITSEQTYWNTVSLALAGIVSGSGADVQPLPLQLIAAVKGCAINSNWDLAYLVLCSHFLAQCAKQHPSPRTSFERLADAFNGQRLDYDDICRTLTSASTPKGFALLERAGAQLDRLAGNSGGNFSYGGPAYYDLHTACQRLHDEKFQSEASIEPEQPSVDVVRLRSLFERLKSDGRVSLGIATGRTRKEAFRALREFGIASFFRPERIVCYDDVTAAEQASRASGIPQSLTKPNPYSILRAVYPDDSLHSIITREREPLSEVFYVGDGVSDVLAAKAAGAISIGVLTGIPDLQDFQITRKHELLSAGCDYVVPTVLEIEQALADAAR